MKVTTKCGDNAQIAAKYKDRIRRMNNLYGTPFSSGCRLTSLDGTMCIVETEKWVDEKIKVTFVEVDCKNPTIPTTTELETTTIEG